MLGRGVAAETRQTEPFLRGVDLLVAPQGLVLSSNYGASEKSPDPGMCFRDEV